MKQPRQTQLSSVIFSGNPTTASDFFFFIIKNLIKPDDDVGRVLKLESVSGHKLRVEKWRSSKAPSYTIPTVMAVKLSRRM